MRGRQTADWPARFYVGGGVSGGWGGGGWVTVAPGELRYEPGGLARRLSGVGAVVHSRDYVTVVRAQLLPPLFDTGLLIVGEGRFARLLTWYGRDVALVNAIRAAGYAVDERRTWVTLGWRLGAEELARGAVAKNHSQ